MEKNGEFHRQRRNLIAVSMLLLVYSIVGIEFDRYGFFGTTFKVANPDSIIWILWFMCMYLLYRFLLYAVPAAREHSDINIHEEILRELYRINNLGDGVMPTELLTPFMEDSSAREFATQEFSRAGLGKYDLRPLGPLSYELAPHFNRLTLATCHPAIQDLVRSLEVYPAPMWLLCKLRVKVTWKWINMTWITDFAIPIVMGIAALCLLIMP